MGYYEDIYLFSVGGRDYYVTDGRADTERRARRSEVEMANLGLLWF